MWGLSLRYEWEPRTLVTYPCPPFPILGLDHRFNSTDAPTLLLYSIMVTGKSMCPIHPHFVSRFTLFADSHSLVRYIIPLSVGPQRRLTLTLHAL